MDSKQDSKTNRRVYTQQFLNILQALNRSQKKAVNTIEGPVLAIAGPGTGKTHILTARIGQILSHTDAKAHNILCLTFTDASVKAMRDRLLEFIGPEAHRVHIYTFHSFCNKIIQENLSVFGHYNLEPLADLERIEIIRELLEQLDFEHPLKAHRRDPFHYEMHLQNLFRKMKAEAWTADYISQQIDIYLEDLPNQANFIYQRKSGRFKKGDIKIAKVEEISLRMERLRAGAYLFENYKQLLSQYRRYDYEDMILWVTKAFEQEEYLLRTYQEQYLYLLVDEYQDTNGAQNKIIHQLVEYWEEQPNLFIVGDDDQSIYEFQGARVKNMLDFYENYKKNLTLVLLHNNYRSSQHILNAAKALIDQNEIRMIHHIQETGLDKLLIASNPHFATSTKQVSIRAYQNRIQEEIAILQAIQTLQLQGVSLNEIAIIYAKHRQAENLILLLEKNNISYRSKRKINILHLPLVQNLRQLMQYIQLESQEAFSGEEYFFEILHYDFLGILAEDLSSLNAFMALNKHAHSKQKEKKQPPILSWQALVRDLSLLKKLGLKEPKSVYTLGKLLDKLFKELQNQSLANFFQKLINHIGLLSWVSQHENKIWHVQILNTLFEFIKKECLKKPKLKLKEFLETLQRMEDNHISLGIYKTIYAEDGVNLLTAHSCKGLEFQHVFMINCLKNFWEPGMEHQRRSFPFPDTISFSNQSDAMEAARRLFYVAMTRAKEGLQLSYYLLDQRDKAQNHSSFIDEVLENQKQLQVEVCQLESQSLIQEQLLLLHYQQKPKIQLLDTITLDRLLENFRLSISAMNTYLNCPLSFYYEYILRLPSLSSEEAAYGTAMHLTLERLFEQVKHLESKQFPHIDEILSIFHQEMEKQKIYFNDLSYAKNLTIGLKHLSLYYAQRRESWEEGFEKVQIWTEKAFRNVEMNGIPLTGVIDKLIFFPTSSGKKVEVVDYKTGKIKVSQLRSPSKHKPEGGNYWRQLVFYKILFEHAKILPYRVRTASIDYLSPDSKQSFLLKTIELKAEDARVVKNLIQKVYKKIQAHQFAEGCGHKACKWCAFAKRNISQDSFYSKESKQMDDPS